ncbi:uncharacterized protein EI90DRAFT_3018632 [Cantharellus anzutake]|uniref:uncharacterized protein n=1 Tax=Cantharellus anzutake TaxID=1750568 RepID=UPI00190492A0|nr:uncharacterized protein EI90DRAFT_3018632 [Cantharellus anzutake]KAF8326310.1 hypothetical protein EI90DRAFT_3018632 [Cantharellus anzutake]
MVHSPVYATGSCHKQPNDHSCWRREPFGVPKNVEKSSTSTEWSRVSRETSSLRYSSKPVHSPVYATGSCANRSNDNSCQHREPSVVAKNVEKTSTLSTSSHINCETSSPQNRSMLVHSPVYVTGNCAKQSNNNSCLHREPSLIAKNVEKTSTSSLPSCSYSETSSSPPRREPVQTPVYKTGNHQKPSWDDPRLCREPALRGGNVEKTSTPPTPSHNHCETLSALSENECTHSNMDIKAMSSRSTQTHRLSSLPDCPQMASDPAWTQQRDQVPSEWRTGSDEELLLRLKAREIIGEKVKGRCSESTEAPGKPLLPRPNPKLLPKKAKSPTSDEVTEVCRSATWQKKEPSKENPQMSGQPSTPGPILGDKWPSSVTSPRQRISGSNLLQNPSSNAGENQTNPCENFTRKTSSKTLLEDNWHLERWYHKATWMAKLLTFTPHIDRVKWDWLNNGPTRLPDMKWSGENDTEIFWQWYTTLLGFLTSRGYRGAHYDEIHLDCLIGGLAEPALSHGLKLHEEALLRDKGGKFLEVLDTLMRTYIKEPTTLKYNAGKGPRQSYPKPSLNARFLDNILPECKEEIIKMGFSSFEEMFRTTSRMDEMKNRLRIAPAYRPERYARPETTATTNREKPNQMGREKHAEARANVQDPKPKWKGESSLKQSGNTDQRPVQVCNNCGIPEQTKSRPEHQLVGDRNPRHRIAREVDYKTEGEVGDDSDEEELENISGDFKVEDTSNDFEPEDPNKGPHYSPRRKGEDISVGTIIMAPRSNIIENNDKKNTLKLAIKTKKRTTNSLVTTPKRDPPEESPSEDNTPEKKTSEGDPLKEDPLEETTPESPEEDELWVEFILGWLVATIHPLPSRNTGLHHAHMANKANQPSSYLKEDQELADKIK